MTAGELDGGVSGGALGGVAGVGEGSEVLGAVVGGQEPVAVGCPPEEDAGVAGGDAPQSEVFALCSLRVRGPRLVGPVWPGVPSHRYGLVWSSSMPGLVAPE